MALIRVAFDDTPIAGILAPTMNQFDASNLRYDYWICDRCSIMIGEPFSFRGNDLCDGCATIRGAALLSGRLLTGRMVGGLVFGA